MFKKFRSYFTNRPAVSPEHKERLKRLKRVIDAEIDDPFIYIRALRHRSILADESYSPADSYERLEFLGDAVLDLIVTEIIFQKYPQENEGFLTKLRAKLVKGDTLAKYAVELGLSELLVLGERAQGQGIEFSKSVLADVFEALVGAIYIDKGYKVTFHFVEKVITKNLDFTRLIDALDNYKSMLLEYAQAHKYSIPEYKVVAEQGPGHDKTFEIKVVVNNVEMGRGKGKNKKEAEQIAAKEALRLLEKS